MRGKVGAAHCVGSERLAMGGGTGGGKVGGVGKEEEEVGRRREEGRGEQDGLYVEAKVQAKCEGWGSAGLN